MAKKPTAAKAAETTDETKGDGRGRAITLPNGQKRADYIREQYSKGKSRSDIAKALTEMQGKEVPYQVVFAATKGLEQGKPLPPKEPKAEKASKGKSAAA